MCSSSLPRVMWLVLANELWEVIYVPQGQILSTCDPPSPAKPIWKPHVKTMKSQQLVSLRCYTHNGCMKKSQKHTDIYVNKKSMESLVLVCYCNRAYSILTSKESLSKKKPFTNLWSTNEPFKRISWISRKVSKPSSDRYLCSFIISFQVCSQIVITLNSIQR